jgi:phage major head subunit gpT-like protein
MAIIGTGLTTPGLKAEFFKRLDGLTPLYTELTTRIPSTTKKETYAFLGSVPPMREWGTGRKARGVFSESYDVENLKYEATLEVDRDELADDQHGQIRVRINELADRAGYHKDNVIATLLVNGGSAGYLAYDGKTFFANDHESGKSGAQDNTLSIAITDKDDPTSAEFRSAFGDGVARLLGFVDDQAEPMSVSAGGLVCVVPPSMYVAALEALNTTMLASTSNVLQGAAKVITFPRLTATDVWYLLKTDVAVRPFIFQDREPIEFGSLEKDSESGFIREQYIYGVRARYRITFGYWQYALQCTFTTS